MGRATMGWMTPVARMDCASSSRLSSRKRVRGWCGFGSIRSMSTSRMPPAGRATSVGSGLAFWSSLSGGSGSRIKALKPLPNAFRAIGNYLLGKLDVAGRSCAVYVIEYNRLTVTWGFGKADVARDHGLEDLLAEEAAEV